jgi:hypothetical protein
MPARIGEALLAKLSEWGAEVLDQAVDELVHQLDQAVPHDTGELANSLTVRVQDSPPTFGVEVSYSAPQAEWTEHGTSPHPIEGNPLLVFYWERVGRVVFLRHVDHPGSDKHKGWFSTVTSVENWQAILEQARDRVSV